MESPHRDDRRVGRSPPTWKPTPTDMPAAVIPITGRSTGAGHSAVWSLLQVALPGREPLPFGILFADATDRLYFRLREDLSCFEELCEQERDIFAAIGDDLQLKGRESGGRALLAAIEDSASNFFQVTDRSPSATPVRSRQLSTACLTRMCSGLMSSRPRRRRPGPPPFCLSGHTCRCMDCARRRRNSAN